MENEPFLGSTLAWTLLIGFAIVWVGLGVFWSRRVPGTAQYLFAGRNVGLALVTATLMATWVTGNTVLAAPEQAYLLGLWGVIGYALAGLGLLMFAPLSVRIRQLMPNGFTSGDFIRLRFGKPAWAIFLTISAVYFLGWLISQGMAGPRQSRLMGG